MQSLKPALVGLAVLAVVGLSAAEWSSLSGLACVYDKDWPQRISGTCGDGFLLYCRGARTNGTIAYGHKPEAYMEGHTIHAHVHVNDYVHVEQCCNRLGMPCDVADAGYSLRVFNP